MAVCILTKTAGTEGSCLRISAALVVFFLIIPWTGAAMESGPVKVQVLEGEILPGQAAWYRIPGLNEGDTWIQ